MLSRGSFGQGLAPSDCVGWSIGNEFWPLDVGAIASRSIGGHHDAGSRTVADSCSADDNLAVLDWSVGVTTVPLVRREWRISAI